MMLFIQLCLFCALLTALVYLFTWGKAVSIFIPNLCRSGPLQSVWRTGRMWYGNTNCF